MKKTDIDEDSQFLRTIGYTCWTHKRTNNGVFPGTRGILEQGMGNKAQTNGRRQEQFYYCQ